MPKKEIGRASMVIIEDSKKKSGRKFLKIPIKNFNSMERPLLRFNKKLLFIVCSLDKENSEKMAKRIMGLRIKDAKIFIPWVGEKQSREA
jgi:hypothetical protein